MQELLLTLIALSSGVLCNAVQNLTDTVISDPVGILNTSGNEYSTSTDQQIHKVTKRCVKQSLRSDYISTPGVGAFKLHTRKLKWTKARKSCMSEGGVLAIINSEGEAGILLNWMKKENIWDTWLGIHDQFDEGDWVTLQGDTLEIAGYDKWLPKQPDNYGGNENCGSLRGLDGLNDLPCDNELPFFCKIYIC